ncbi:hypothetical protein [Spirillospora sp. NPDC048819]|uniref:hypothetical protein n=1 Tax=Spirillospora sp. NPDC048819 TaxID=3155268 RepID=UPI0033D462BE
MGYVLRAVIANAEILRSATDGLAHARLAALRQGLALLPVTDDLFDAVGDPAADRLPGFPMLPGGFDRTLAAWSHAGPVAYAEADYFGGTGEQHAAVWDGGHLVFGPLHTPEDEPFSKLGSPISQALRQLGADAGREFDEFAAVGLGRHRATEDWIPA